MPPDFDWKNIDTVLLDMDGTLLDLAFDSRFWLHTVPLTLSQKRHIPIEDAKALIHREYLAVQHTMNWYCFDYWAEKLDLDIYQMIADIGATARLREDTLPFLHALRDSGRRTILLTNAHTHGLAVKIAHTGLDKHLDLLLSTHTFGYPKEDHRLWQAVQKHLNFDSQRTLFVDDGEPILDAAKNFGIRYCLGIENPDSSAANKVFLNHPSVNDYHCLLPSLQHSTAAFSS
ncbi:GMP/IMP nucleotidase [Rouxiella sp. Mn2063]|uniref:GMP/IMP nucleotidase n=1 Tax=Rouxiella sp. Mn2063 TaxID=3395262 RepID=UPI003BBE5EC8